MLSKSLEQTIHKNTRKDLHTNVAYPFTQQTILYLICFYNMRDATSRYDIKAIY